MNQIGTSTWTPSGGTATTSTISYDVSGNMKGQTSASGGTSYTYDEADRLIRVSNTSSGVNSSKSEFVYDGMSRLVVSKEFNWTSGAWVQGSEKRRVYDGMDVVQERDGASVNANAVTASLIRDGNIGGILSRTTSTGTFYYNYDGSGNVTQLTDASQNIVAEYGYDAYGNATSSGSQAGQPYGYSTKEQLGGLLFYGFRFYNAGLGRWINRDPIAESGGVNLYAMVGNSPTNRIDAHGESAALLVGGLVVVGGGLLAWQGSDWDSNHFTRPQAVLIAREINMMKNTASSCGGGDSSVIKYLNSMNVIGVFRHGGTSEDSSSLSRPGMVVRGPRTNLSADFFSRPTWSQLRTLLHESYHAGTGNYGGADESGDAERWANRALQKLAPCLNKRYGVSFPQAGGYRSPGPKHRWIPKQIGPF